MVEAGWKNDDPLFTIAGDILLIHRGQENLRFRKLNADEMVLTETFHSFRFQRASSPCKILK